MDPPKLCCLVHPAYICHACNLYECNDCLQLRIEKVTTEYHFAYDFVERGGTFYSYRCKVTNLPVKCSSNRINGAWHWNV